MNDLQQPVFTLAEPDHVLTGTENVSWMESALNEYFDHEDIQMLAPAVAVELALRHGHIVKWHDLGTTSVLKRLSHLRVTELMSEHGSSVLESVPGVESRIANFLVEAYRCNNWINISVQVELFVEPFVDLPGVLRYVLLVDGTTEGDPMNRNAAEFIVDTTSVFYPMVDDSFIREEDRKGYLHIDDVRKALIPNEGSDHDVLASMEMHINSMGRAHTYIADNYVFFNFE